MSHVLEVKNLKTEFKTEKGILKAINGVSYYLDKGEIVAFVGESGSGKSVTQYSSLQLIPMPPGKITDGEILFEGNNILDYSQNSPEMQSIRGGEVGVVFQEPMTSLNPIMTVGAQILEGVRLHLHLERTEARAYAVELLKKVGLSDPEKRLDYYPHQFSGGMRQRIMIAIALSCNPKILIADEATSALDVTTQAQILELMRALVVETNTTLVLVTHNLSLVARYANRVYVMYAGEIMESGNTAEIFSNPRHPYTIGLMNAVPSLTDRKDRKLIPIEGLVSDLTRRKDQCVFVNRCPFADGECENLQAPVLENIKDSPNHFAACHKIITKESKSKKKDADTIRKVSDISGKITGDPILKVENLKVSYPIRSKIMQKVIGHIDVVDDISFDVYPGETLGFVGESGCGKTTVAKTVMRLIEPTEGRIIFNGNNITKLKHGSMQPIRRNLSMIFQDPFGSLDPRQRALDAIKEPMKNFNLRMTNQQMEEKAVHLMELVGINPVFKNRMPHQFSGGQRQRIAIARALSTDPSFIVCDEAVSALDVSIQAQIINLMVELQEKLGLSYLFIAHDLSVVRHISDRIAVMYLGQIVEEADWESLYKNPLHPYTQVLLEAVPVPVPELEAKRKYHLIKGEVPSVMNRPKGCPFSSRCNFVMERCTQERPKLRKAAGYHTVACFYAESKLN